MLLCGLAVSAQDRDDFGIWSSVDVAGRFSPKWDGGMYFEHRSKSMTKELDCALIMPYVSYKPWKFLKFGLASEYVDCGDVKQLTLRPSATFSLSSGPLGFSFRALPIYEYTFQTSSGAWTMRSRAKMTYNIESIRLTPYVSIEVFTADHWKKTRNFLGAQWSFGKHSAVDLYYMYYIMAGMRSQRHILGLGYVFNVN